jgi:nicotinamide/nicotinate riboside kinase
MVIGIGGCSRSGKSMLASDLVWHFRNQNKRAIAVSQDDFVFRINDIPIVKDRTDWDTPASLDFELMRQTVDYLSSFFDVVILEGHFVFFNFKLKQLFDYQIFSQISEATFRQRRASETRWGQELDWFISHVWNSFLKFGQPSFSDTNLLTISGEKPFEIQEVVAFLMD